MRPSSKNTLIVVVCLLLASALTACASSNREIPITLKETNVNEVIQSADTNQDAPFRIESVDMKDGFMRVFMSYRKADRTVLNGSYDVALNIENGKIVAKILDVDMPGLALDDQILQQIAELIAHDFSFAAANIANQVEFVSQKMSEDSLDLVIRIVR